MASFCSRSEEEKKEKAETKEQVRKDRTKPGREANVERERGGGKDVGMRKVPSAGRAGGRGRCLMCLLLLGCANKKREAYEPEEPRPSCGGRRGADTQLGPGGGAGGEPGEISLLTAALVP